MHGGTTRLHRGDAYLRALIGMATVYVAGRALLPFAGHDAVELWRIAAGAPVFLASAALVLARARRHPGRARDGWTLIGIGIACYPLGTLLTAAFGSSTAAPPAAHAAWLAFYLCAYVGLAGIAHAALRPFPSAFLLDGVAVVLALGAALTAGAAVYGTTPYRLWEAALGLSYPALDLVLVGYIAWIVSVRPRPVDLVWRRLLAALGLLLAADLLFVALGLSDQLSDIAVNTAAYPVVMVLLAWAATAPTPEPTPLRLDTRMAVVMPAATVVVLLGSLVAVALEPNDGPAIPLVALALLVLMARLFLIQRFATRLAESRRFERGFDEAGVGMGIADLSGHWIRVNPSLARLLGRAPSDLVGRDVLEQVEGDHHAAARALRSQLLRGAAAFEPVHLRLAVPGDTRDIVLLGDLVAGGDTPQFFVQVRDVTSERRARRHADAVSSISRQALALDDLQELLGRVVPELADALDAALVAWIPLDAAERPISLPATTTLDPGVLEDLRVGGGILLDARDERGVDVHDPRAIELGLPSLFRRGIQSVSFVRIQPRAASRAMLCVAREMVPEDATEERTCLDTIANVLATAADRAHDERASRHRALHDPLTGLANRALLSAHLAQALASGRREGSNVGVLLIDLDRFKLVNDTLGHEIGDALLRAVAERLERHTRQGDLLARLGGDEFVLVASRVSDPQEVERVAARIVEALDEPIALGGRELSVGASIGVAIMSSAVATPDMLVREADLAMYRAKRAGGGRWSRGEENVHACVGGADDVERDLRDAVEHDGLRLALQPQLALVAPELVGFEALVRWARPGHGLMYPEAFVPLASTVGLLGPIGEWVLARGLEFLGELDRAGAAELPRLAVNLLPAQLTPQLPETVDRLTAQAGVRADRIRVEVPAKLVVTDEAAMDILERLRDRGVSVALEDFGTGWTSLTGLLRYPVDALKLDRALVARLPDSPTARTVARATVRLAEELGLVVTAAGVETTQQLDAVRDLGITVAQGHLLAPPLAAEDAITYARARSWESVLTP